MNFTARELADHLVAIIYNVENLILHNSTYCVVTRRSIAKQQGVSVRVAGRVFIVNYY